MAAIKRCELYSGLSFVAAALALNWLMESEGSPLYRYFLFHVSLPNLWAFLNSIPYVVGLVTGVFFSALFLPNSSGYYLGLFGQWFAVGWLCSKIYCRGTTVLDKTKVS